ncbi:MAG: hypothetical protein LQ342_001985 [Letrouitia transgressa]|nr:MAG: hypothetical protein LQ342_001985 [Letrouitia transgressa]
MDPFSAEGELLTLYNAFHQGQYATALDFDTSSLSKSNSTPARILKLRAQIASGDARGALASIQNENEPDFTAVQAFAQYTLGDTSTATEHVENLVETASDNATVQILCGTILQGTGRTEEALSLITLTTQIHLSQNRTDLALKEVSAARKWAQDNLLVNIAEAWAGMRVGGESYQSAFYVFEELAQTPSTTAPKSLISQSLAELHLGRLPEAEAALSQALEKEPRDIEAVANAVVLGTIMGKRAEVEERMAELKGRGHPLLEDLEEKGKAFDVAAAKYAARAA